MWGRSTVRRGAVRGVVRFTVLLTGWVTVPTTGALAQTGERPPATGRPRADSVPQGLAKVVVSGAAERTAGYRLPAIRSADRAETPLREIPQSVTVVGRSQIADQAMQSMADVVRYVPGITMGLGEGHRDAPTLRGQSSTADFFVNGARDDAQYLRDLYNIERVELLKGPNALLFGRGGGGGVINRVTRDAQWRPVREWTAEAGAFAHRRGTLDVGQALSPLVAARLMAMADRSGSFRLPRVQDRWAVHPTVALRLAPTTFARIRTELFNETRAVDRGIPAFRGQPVDVADRTLFGNLAVNRASMAVRSLSAQVEHATAGGTQWRSQLHWSGYDKAYQNSFPGPLTDDGQLVSLAAYRHEIDRRNLFSQTDVSMTWYTGRVQHRLLGGVELGSQRTEQLRQTGYFNGREATLRVPLLTPAISTPVVFQAAASDAAGRSRVTTAAAFLQDRLSLSESVQLLAGLRVEQLSMVYANHRDGSQPQRTDRVLTPRLGLIVRPWSALTTYASLTQSALPSSGDQFMTLTVTTGMLRPERFTNREVGFTWEPVPTLAVTGAWYDLHRTNSAAPDPTDPTRLVQTGAQRSRGVELGLTGGITDWWQVAGGGSVQTARLLSRTTTATAGATVPLVPHATASLWNRWSLSAQSGLGLGVVHQTAMYAAIDNSVRLPGFTRVDAAFMTRFRDRFRVQLHVENLLNCRYTLTSHGNHNIMPGAPRTVRLTITAGAP